MGGANKTSPYQTKLDPSSSSKQAFSGKQQMVHLEPKSSGPSNIKVPNNNENRVSDNLPELAIGSPRKCLQSV